MTSVQYFKILYKKKNCRNNEFGYNPQDCVVANKYASSCHVTVKNVLLW